MARFLAYLFLLSATFLNTLGNFYFTYGIWPQSWGSFFLFAFMGALIAILAGALRESER